MPLDGDELDVETLHGRRFVAELPQTIGGKILKYRLRALLGAFAAMSR